VEAPLAGVRLDAVLFACSRVSPAFLIADRDLFHVGPKQVTMDLCFKVCIENPITISEYIDNITRSQQRMKLMKLMKLIQGGDKSDSSYRRVKN
jgi:hypothetical protein